MTDTVPTSEVHYGRGLRAASIGNAVSGLAGEAKMLSGDALYGVAAAWRGGYEEHGESEPLPGQRGQAANQAAVLGIVRQGEAVAGCGIGHSLQQLA